MPTYSTLCDSCGSRPNMKLTFTDYEAVRGGTKPLPCPACQGKLAIVFNPDGVGFSLKDGESGGWISKSMKENKYRNRHRGVMEQRQRDHAPNPKLVPNFAGEVLGSWQEAKEAAYDKALRETQDVAAATQASQTYDSLVKQDR